MNLRLKRTPGIYLVGFMGSGKSTIGRLLAAKLGWPFFDLDEEIEARERTAIAAIFETRGEAEFRRIEAQVVLQHVRWIERGRPAVVALGGGAFGDPATRQLLRDNGISVWLDCAYETVARRAAHDPARPLARDPQAFQMLYHARRETYEMADVHLTIGEEAAETIVEVLLAHPMLQ